MSMDLRDCVFALQNERNPERRNRKAVRDETHLTTVCTGRHQNLIFFC